MLRPKTRLEILSEEGGIIKGIFAIISEKSKEFDAINAEFQFSLEGLRTPNKRFILEKEGRVFLHSPDNALTETDRIIAALFKMSILYAYGVPVPQPGGSSLSEKFLLPAISYSQAKKLVQALK